MRQITCGLVVLAAMVGGCRAKSGSGGGAGAGALVSPVRNACSIYGKVADETGRPLRARVELWQLSAKDEKNSATRHPPGTQVLYHAGFTTENGWYNLEGVAGRYLVRICKGPEWEIAEFEVEVEAADGQGIRRDVPLRRLYDLKSAGWYSGDLHHHSLHSDGWQRPHEIYEAALAMDCDFVALTDHNTLTQTAEWMELASRWFLPVPGFEITTWQNSSQRTMREGFGHMNALGVRSLINPLYEDQTSVWKRYQYESWEDVQQAIDETHDNGGLLVLNHPISDGESPAGTISTWGKIHNYDAIEIFNGGEVAPFLRGPADIVGRSHRGVNANTVAAQVWFEFLNAGNKVAAIAGSDCHDTTAMAGKTPRTARISFWRRTTGTPRTYVHSGQLTWPTVKAALKGGRGFITAGYWGPILLVDSNGAEPGDEIRVRPGQELPLRIQVMSNRPLKGYANGIRIIQGGRVVTSLPTEEGKMSMDIRTSVKIEAAGDTWLVVQVFGQYPAAAMTNAIYLSLPPHDGWGAKQWAFPPDADTWCNPWPNAPEITVPDGPSLPEGVKDDGKRE